MNWFEASIRYNIDFIFNDTEKVIDIIIVELDDLQFFVYIHCGWKIGINC